MARLRNVVVIGGGGTFGRWICRNLVGEPGIRLIVAGRKPTDYGSLLREMASLNPACELEAARLNIYSPSLAARLRNLEPDIVIHTSGPFQGQDYRVAQACLAVPCHYIDLADGRDFVCNFPCLNSAAEARGVLLVSGASSVPGLSSAVVDHYRPLFKRLDRIDYAIAPGNRQRRGLATVAAILGGTGQPFATWRDSRWQTAYGWMASESRDFGGPTGRRRVADINIPDLQLFPERYYPVQTVRFKAGLELGILHHAMRAMAWLARQRLVRNWAPCAGLCLDISRWFYPFGSDVGAMQVNLEGLGYDYRSKTVNWTLTAEHGAGPNIPCIPAVIVARKLLRREIHAVGAKACMGLFDLPEFMALARKLGIYFRIEGCREDCREASDAPAEEIIAPVQAGSL